MDRKNVADNYKWNLKDIYASDKEWLTDLEILKQNIDILASYKGKFNNKEELLKFYKFSDIDEIIVQKVFAYNGLNHDIDLNNSLYKEREGILENYYADLSDKLAFVAPELAALSDEYLNSVAQDPNFSDYRHGIEKIIRNKKYVLSEKEERALSVLTSFEGGFSNIYETLTESEMKFKPVLVDGKKEKLTMENFALYIRNPDRKIRTMAFNNLYSKFKSLSKTLAEMYIYSVKKDCSSLKLRGQMSYLDATLYSDNMPSEVYYNLINNVNKNIPTMHEYFGLLKQNSGLTDFSFQDVYLSIASKTKRKFLFEEQKEIIKAALMPLGKEYNALLDNAFNSRWIDLYSNDEKAGGGYNLGIYDCHPYILLNDNADFDSMSTAAHELGHAMHSTYSNKCQPISNANYSIFVAEVASTVNEVLLLKYMLKHSKTKEERLFYLDDYAQKFKSTLFRQTMFSEFEDYAHKLIENNQPISYEILNKKYTELNKKHFGSAVSDNDLIQYEWLKISHFYRPYYVYNYATSFTAAVYIANCILEGKNDMLENYKNLLKSGDSDYPNSLLNKIGVNLQTNEPYEIAFKDLNATLTEMKEILSTQVINKEIESL